TTGSCKWVGLSASSTKKLFKKIAESRAAEMELYTARPFALLREILPVRRGLESSSAALPIRAQRVIFLPLLGITQNFVGLVDFLEFRLGGFLVLFLRHVGMMLPRELAEGLADFILRRHF